MAIDIKRLLGDAEALHAAQKKPPASGSYAAIREALPAIEAMREKGVAWKTIAAALGQQGLTQRQGDVEIPITTSRLTSLVSDVRAGQARAEGKSAQRHNRADLSKTLLKSEQSRKCALSDELAVKPADVSTPPSMNNEEAIRRERFDAIKRLFKDEN